MKRDFVARNSATASAAAALLRQSRCEHVVMLGVGQARRAISFTERDRLAVGARLHNTRPA